MVKKGRLTIASQLIEASLILLGMRAERCTNIIRGRICTIEDHSLGAGLLPDGGKIGEGIKRACDPTFIRLAEVVEAASDVVAAVGGCVLEVGYYASYEGGLWVRLDKPADVTMLSLWQQDVDSRRGYLPKLTSLEYRKDHRTNRKQER